MRKTSVPQHPTRRIACPPEPLINDNNKPAGASRIEWRVSILACAITAPSNSLTAESARGRFAGELPQAYFLWLERGGDYETLTAAFANTSYARIFQSSASERAPLSSQACVCVCVRRHRFVAGDRPTRDPANARTCCTRSRPSSGKRRRPPAPRAALPRLATPAGARLAFVSACTGPHPIQMRTRSASVSLQLASS